MGTLSAPADLCGIAAPSFPRAKRPLLIRILFPSMHFVYSHGIHVGSWSASLLG